MCCFIRVLLLSIAKCCCTFFYFSRQSCNTFTIHAVGKNKNAVMNNAFLCKQFDSWKSFSISCIDFFFPFSLCSSLRLWQIWTGSTLINPLEIHLFGYRCSLLPPFAFFSSSFVRIFVYRLRQTCASVFDISCFPVKFVWIFLFFFVSFGLIWFQLAFNFHRNTFDDARTTNENEVQVPHYWDRVFCLQVN